MTSDLTEITHLGEISERIKTIESSLAELQKHKGLLYYTGVTLQELVRSTLENLGVQTEPSAVTDEFIIKLGHNRALVEVKGNTKSVVKDDLSQLIADLLVHHKTTGEDIHGLLIGNAWRLLPLDQRGGHNKPIFTQEVLKIAADSSIGLLSTTELFNAFCRAVEKPTQREEIVNKIVCGTGEITF